MRGQEGGEARAGGGLGAEGRAGGAPGLPSRDGERGAGEAPACSRAHRALLLTGRGTVLFLSLWRELVLGRGGREKPVEFLPERPGVAGVWGVWGVPDRYQSTKPVPLAPRPPSSPGAAERGRPPAPGWRSIPGAGPSRVPCSRVPCSPGPPGALCGAVGEGAGAAGGLVCSLGLSQPQSAQPPPAGVRRVCCPSRGWAL